MSSFENVQRVLEATLCNISEEMCNLKAQMMGFQQRHQECSTDNSLDTRFTKIPVGELSLGLEAERSDIPVLTVLKDETGRYQDGNEMAVVAASDGSIMAKRERRVAAAAAYFAHGSALNAATVVINAPSSLLPEIDAYILLLKIAVREGVKKLVAVIDNTGAITFVQTAITSSVINSKVLQDYLCNNPQLESRAKELRLLSMNFSLLIICWQRSHTNPNSIYSQLNCGEDINAKQRASEVLELLLK